MKVLKHGDLFLQYTVKAWDPVIEHSSDASGKLDHQHVGQKLWSKVDRHMRM